MDTAPYSKKTEGILSPAVSVIVPLYNVAPYIEKCARSLFEQTIDNLEILFVDDCSPDDSVEIIKRTLTDYPHRQSKTRIIKMPSKGGLAAVRRQGIIEAKGDFIIHCDGDDWVDVNLYEKMYEIAINENSDIVICDLIEVFTDRSIRHRQMPISDDSHTVLKNWYHNVIHMSCCNKLVRRSVYLDKSILPWPGLNMWEDNGLIPRLFYNASKISYVSDAAYYYNRMNVGAMTLGYGMKQVEQMIGIANNLSEFFSTKPDGERYRKTIDAFKYLARINLITDSYTNYKRFRRTFSDSKYIAAELDRHAFSTKGRIRYFMVRYGFASLFILMFKFKNLLRR